MSLTFEQLHDLPSPFYRVAVKALIFDDQDRLLLGVNQDGDLELPGGGWEHDESLEEGLQRELQEELGVSAATISPVAFVFQGKSVHGWRVLRLVVRATLESQNFQPGDGIVGARFVTREELLQANIGFADKNIKEFADEIWPNSANG